MYWCCQLVRAIAASSAAMSFWWSALSYGQENYDIQRPDRAAHPRAVARIAKVTLPQQDPVGGMRGALMTHWR